MKRKEQSVLLAGLLAFGLAACTTDRMGTSDTASASASQQETGESAYGTDTTGSTAMGTSGATGATAGSATGQTPTTAEQGMADTTGAMEGMTGQSTADTRTGAMSEATNSVVTLIEVVPRQGTAGAGAGTMAGAAVGGTGAGATGSSADRVYRITLRMDDGTTRVVTQESAPSFRSGDRVNLMGGEIQRR